MSARRKIIMKAMQGDPVKYTGSPLPKKPVNLNDQVLMGAWSDDDPEVCLNCEMPPERCHGTDDCYLKHKEKKENADSH